MSLNPISPEIKLGILSGTILLLLDLSLKSVWPEMVINQGSVLGFPAENSILIVVHSIIVIVGGLFFWRKVSADRFTNYLIFLALIASLSNLIDRIALGGVRDYIFLGSIWFNIADAAITSAIILTILRYLYAEIHSYRSRQN